jgi:hypothetical protein
MLVEESRVVSGYPGLPLLDRLFRPVAGPASSVHAALRDRRFSVNLSLTLLRPSRPPACKVRSRCRLLSLTWDLDLLGSGPNRLSSGCVVVRRSGHSAAVGLLEKPVDVTLLLPAGEPIGCHRSNEESNADDGDNLMYQPRPVAYGHKVQQRRTAHPGPASGHPALASHHIARNHRTPGCSKDRRHDGDLRHEGGGIHKQVPTSSVSPWTSIGTFCPLLQVTATGPRSAPSNLIGANGFAGQDHCSRVCRAEHGRAEGAPLTVILNGKRILGTVGRVTCTDRLRAVPETA